MNFETFKSKLEEEKKKIEDQLRTLGVKNTETNDWEAVPAEEVSGPEADENDLADRFEDFEERSSLVKELESRLEEVNSAISKIEKNAYGICSVCGQKIEEERLIANPAAATCIEHKES